MLVCYFSYLLTYLGSRSIAFAPLKHNEPSANRAPPTPPLFLRTYSWLFKIAVCCHTQHRKFTYYVSERLHTHTASFITSNKFLFYAHGGCVPFVRTLVHARENQEVLVYDSDCVSLKPQFITIFTADIYLRLTLDLSWTYSSQKESDTKCISKVHSSID